MFKKVPGAAVIRLSLTAISTALVCVATMIFSIYVPKTEGFFNIGETMIYITAVLFGTFVGSFAGGVGSMLADLLLGFYPYAPATLAIKACEGALVGVLSQKKPKLESKVRWKALMICAGLIAGLLLGIIGSTYYSGDTELYLGIPPPPTPNVVFSVPPLFWYAFGALVAILIAVAGLMLEPEFGSLIFSMLLGGSVMVTGYFLYEQFLLFPLFGVAAVALAEVPINIVQMLIGSIVAVPVAGIILRSLPQLRE